MTFAALVAVLFAASGAFAQNRIVTYSAPAKNAGKTPDFKNAVFAFNFVGPVADELKGWLLKSKGVRRFARSCHDVVDDNGRRSPVICISIGPPTSDQFSGSASSSGFGGSAGGSWSYSHMGVAATAKLVRPDGISEDLGYALGWADAGTNSSYGGGPYGSGSNTSTRSVNSAVGYADRMAVMRLFDHYKVLEIGGHTKMWYASAQEAIDCAFKK